MLAEICADMSDFQSAQSYGQQAAVYESSPKNRQLLFGFCNNCSALAQRETTTAVEVTSAQLEQPQNRIGFMTTANEVLNPTAQNNEKPSEKLKYNASPPPGFVPLPFLGAGN